MSDLFLVWRNLTRRRLRFALTLFAIVVAFLIFGVLASFEDGFTAGSDLTADNRLVTVNRINFTQPLPLAYVNKVRAVEGVDKITHSSWFGAYVGDSRNVAVCFAVDAESYLSIYEDMVLEPAERAAFLANRQGVVVGERLARAQGWKVGDRLPVQSNIYSRPDGSHTWEMVVEGIFSGRQKNYDTNFMIFHFDYLNEGRSFGKDNTGLIVFTTRDPALNDSVARAIDEQFANSFAETQTDTAKAFNRAFVAQLGNIVLIISSVVSAAFFSILLIVGNTMMLAIRERTTEIAVLKMLGFRSARIFRLVLAESLFLSLLGGFAGLGLALLAIGAMRESLAGVLPDLSLSPGIALQALCIMLALGLVTGLLPATNAMRLNIVTALGRN